MKLPKARLVRISVAVLAVAALVFFVAYVRTGLQRELVMATGPAGSAYARYGEQYRVLLARKGVQVTLRETGGTVENLSLLNDPSAGVDVAFLSAGTTRADASPGLRGLGTVFLEALWFFSRDPALVDGDLTALAGKRVSIGSEGSATRAVTEALIRLNRIDPAATQFVGLGVQDAAAQLRRGEIDAALIMTTADSPIVSELLQDPAIDLISFRRTAAYVARYPFLTPLTVPEGVGDLSLNRPSHDVTTFGIPVSLAIREDMHPALQALLLEAASQIHAGPGMFNAAGSYPSPQAIDLPLSDGALQYYKSGVPFLQRHLPFGLAVLTTKVLFVLIPLVGVLYPILRIAPGLYGWAMRRHILRLYGELKLLEHDLGSSTGQARKAALQDQLEQLDSKVGRMRVPVSFAPLVYTLRLHINLIRSRLLAPGRPD